MIFDEKSYRMVCTPWGLEIKKRLLDRNMRQDELVVYLKGRGFNIQKGQLTNLLKGIGTSNRRAEIEAISELLDIPLQRTGAEVSHKQYEKVPVFSNKKHCILPHEK